jgi:hypothetical protein
MPGKEEIKFLVDTYLARVILKSGQSELQEITRIMSRVLFDVIVHEKARVKRANARHKTKTRWSKTEKICLDCLTKIVEKYDNELAIK